jgi:glycosyltransferase involved in cell wall biosynthesis
MKHHIHSVVVSYNRQELTAQAIQSYIETVSLPCTLVIVDNGSDPATEDWLKLLPELYGNVNVTLLGKNRYPGYATNRGWEQMPSQTTLLHRADNDFVFLPGWCEEVLRVLAKDVGQIGLRTKKEECDATSNVGGNCVITRKIWDEGLRYDERSWGHEYYPRGWTEDTLMSPAVIEMGYKWTRVKQPCIRPISNEDPNDPYYQETWRLRGIKPPGGL